MSYYSQETRVVDHRRLKRLELLEGMQLDIRGPWSLDGIELRIFDLYD